MSVNSGDSISIQIMINSLLASDTDCILEVKNQNSVFSRKNITLSGGENIYNYNMMIPTEKNSW